jgi:hypothetical protein
LPPPQDIVSPDTGPGEVRSIRNNCVVVPAEIPGVITVSADSNLQQPNGGYLEGVPLALRLGVVDVTAPGGDDFCGVTPQATIGTVLSTWPTSLAADCPPPFGFVQYGGAYCYLEGTSMATPT